jgi:signal transduction histidine kinase
VEAIRVLIAEDEEVVRDALAELIDSDPDLEVIALATDADEAVALAERERPDVAFVDVKMPGGGARATREIRAGSSNTRMIAFSAYEDRSTVLQMLRAGVVGYIVKGTPSSEVLEAVHRAAQGQGSLSVEVTGDVIHELTKLLDRSERLARDLQELNRTKRDLIQVLAHELFTPITTIQGFAMTVAQHGDALSPDEIRELGVDVARSSRRLQRLVGNLRAAAQLDREGVEVETQLVPATLLVERAVGEFDDAPRIRVMPTDALTRRVWVDPDLAARALVIVLENALDVAPEETSVDISTATSGGRLTISVTDRGPGIMPEMRERIFSPFSQAEDSMTRSHEGLGIGLYLARRIMVANAGAIDVDAQQPVSGAVFTLTFVTLDEEASEVAEATEVPEVPQVAGF